MPAPRLHEDLICDRIVQLIDQNLSAVLGLKVVSFGALEFYPGLENLAANLPAVLVKPASTNLERITTGQTYRINYVFRVVHIKQFGPNEQIVRGTVTEAQKIGELFIDNIDLNSLALPNGQILSTSLKTIEWDPLENNILAMLHGDMTAAAFSLWVETASRK